jgi:hypothetical protein
VEIKKGSREDINSKIKEMVKAGHPVKHAIAASLASARKYQKMSDGGMVDNDLDDEHERGLSELMEQGDQGPVSSPSEESMRMDLASALHKKSEDEEFDGFSMGGLVEGDNDSMEGAKPSEMMPAMMGDSLSEEAKAALMLKKQKRRFS